MRVGTRALASGIGLALILSGCGDAPDEQAGTPEEAGYPTAVPTAEDFDENAEFAISVSLAPSTFDPMTTAGGLDQNYLAPIYDRLIYRSPDGEYEPMLATSWEPSDEDKSITFTLREGVTFHDGTPFNAEAVKIGLDRYRGEGSNLRQELRQVTDVQVVDEHTVTVTVSDSLGALTSALSARAGMIASPKAVADGTLAANPVGAGPYKNVSAIPGQGVTLER